MSTTGTRFTATPVDFTEDQLAQIDYNRDGLVAAIVQDASDGAVLMFAWMNAESLRRTLETGRTLVLEPEPAGALVQGGDLGRPPVRTQRALRLRR